MPFTKNFRTPAQLTGVARGAFRALVESYDTNVLLPARSNYTLDFSVNIGESVLPAAASFRSYSTQSEVGTIVGSETRQGKLPPLSIRTPVDEYQQLFMYGQQEGIGTAFEERAVRNAQAIAARIVLAQAEAIQAGKVTISERNLSLTIDFGRKAGLTANASTAWSTTATATPLADLEALRTALGKAITTVIVSRQAITYLQSNVDLIKIALGRGSDLPSRISEADVKSVFSAWGLGNLVVNEQVVTNRTGAEVPLFAADKVVVLSGSQVGSTDLGVTAESIAAENGIAQAQAAGLFSGASQQDDPSGYNVLVSAIALPVIQAPNNTASLDAY